jgi:ATP-dependent DNA helicase RecG
MGGMLHTELLPVSGAGLHAMDRQRITDYLHHITRDAAMPESDADWSRRLISLGFMTEGPGHLPVCTIAGILLFGQAPRRYLRQSGIRLMIYDGLEKTYEARYDKVIDGPILSLWTTSGDRGRFFAGDGLLDTVDAVLKPFITDEKNVVSKGFRREGRPRFSREVIREVLVNAIAHRDWTRFVDIELVVYADRMELISPGSLPNSMTVEKMIAGQRSPRNPILVDVLRDYGYVDARGMGIRNKVIPLVRAMCGVDPVFEETDDYLKTILPSAQEGERKG